MLDWMAVHLSFVVLHIYTLIKCLLWYVGIYCGGIHLFADICDYHRV